jgi:hypothetical protein
MVVQSDYRGRTQANAQMQFGLVVAPVDRRSRYRLRLLRLSAAPWMRLGERLDIQYRITQYAGSLRDRETEARLGDADSESRGGRIHGLTARHRL